MIKAKISHRITSGFAMLWVVALVLALAIGGISGDAYAKKKKKKKKGQDEEVEAALARKKFIFELNKNWSFGYENYKNKQFDSAARHFWKVTSLDTIDKFPKVYRYLGDCYFKMDKADSAQLIFEIGEKKYPDDAHLHRMVGFLKAQREQVDDAILEYERVVELKADSKDDLKQLAALYVKADRLDDAIAIYDKVLTLDPNDVEAQQNQSALYNATGNIEATIESKEKIRAQQADNSQVRFDLGKAYFDQEQYAKSLEMFNEFLTLSPNDIGAMEYIAKANLKLGKTRAAIREFKKILALEKDNKQVIAEISRSYKELGSFSQARSYANKALALDKSYGLGWIALGEAYEASAEKCVAAKGGKVDFNDKLVYEIAAGKYRQAKKDLAFRQDAMRHLNYLEGVLPSKEDKFMHKDQKKPQGKCYSWF